jgi:hypothetical protein
MIWSELERGRASERTTKSERTDEWTNERPDGRVDKRAEEVRTACGRKEDMFDSIDSITWRERDGGTNMRPRRTD